jgi:small subunit ribosomal protein SAe
MYWLLTREILRLRGSIQRNVPWSVMVDMFFYRDPEEAEKQEEEKAEAYQETSEWQAEEAQEWSGQAGQAGQADASWGGDEVEVAPAAGGAQWGDSAVEASSGW